MSKWLSPKPTHCDICKDDLVSHFYDGKLDSGPWAIMCSECYVAVGVGLGVGQGQMYDLETLKKLI